MKTSYIKRETDRHADIEAETETDREGSRKGKRDRERRKIPEWQTQDGDKERPHDNEGEQKREWGE